jgi:chromosome segregation ATPase
MVNGMASAPTLATARERRITARATQKEESELAEAQMAAIVAAVEAQLKPTIKGLTREVARLATALEEQIQQNETLRSGYETLNENYKALKDTVTSRLGDLGTELTASIGT